MIREATDSDVRLLVDLIRRSFRDVADRFRLTAENCPSHPSNCTRDWIVSAMANGVRFFILEVDETACGCVALEQPNSDVCYLERLAVLPELRGRGYGRTLVEHGLNVARDLGAGRIEIGLIADHFELRDWYLRLGFEITRDNAMFDHLPFGVTLMARTLRPGHPASKPHSDSPPGHPPGHRSPCPDAMDSAGDDGR